MHEDTPLQVLSVREVEEMTDLLLHVQKCQYVYKMNITGEFEPICDQVCMFLNKTTACQWPAQVLSKMAVTSNT